MTAFLQDQVARLSAALARAQDRFEDTQVAAASVGASCTSAIASTGTGRAPAWLLDAEVMPPLLASYDARIAELERTEALQRARAESAERSAQTTSSSADCMRDELRHALEASVRHEARVMMHSGGGGDDGGAGARAGNSSVAIELQDRLEVLYHENEVLVEQQCETAEELARLREEKLSQARDHMSMVKQCATLRDEMGLGEQHARKAADARDRARSELQHCAAELVQANEHTQVCAFRRAARSTPRPRDPQFAAIPPTPQP